MVYTTARNNPRTFGYTERRTMDNKNVVRAYCVSLLVLGILAIATGVMNIAGIMLPKEAALAMSVLQLIAAAVMIAAGVKIYISKKKNKE